MPSRKRSLDALIEDIEKWIDVGQQAVGTMSVDKFSGRGLSFHAGSWCIANAARNRIAHGYYDLDEGQVWKTLKVSFAMLSEKLSSCKIGNGR
jgi:Protein of unknown function DUF86